jgi:hypothetical protein
MKIDLKKVETAKLSTLKPNSNNPRFIRDEKFQKLVKSIKDFPDMLAIRPIVVNKELTVLGGNMRLKACQEAGLKEVPIIKVELTEEQERQFIIKDNVGYGEWDWEIIANEWDIAELEEMGLDLPGDLADADEFGEDFDLNDGDKEPFQQMTFTLADEQATQIKNALEDIKATEEFKYVETFANENGNGNALYKLVMEWAEQKK